jgi:hypothetical protein
MALVDKEFAAERRISAQAPLWEELHEALAPFTMGEPDLGERDLDEGDLGEADLGGQLVREFLEC